MEMEYVRFGAGEGVMRKGDLFDYQMGFRKLHVQYMEQSRLVTERFEFGAAEDPENDFILSFTPQFGDDVAYVMTLSHAHDNTKSIAIDIPKNCLSDELNLMVQHCRQCAGMIPLARRQGYEQKNPGLN